MSTENISFQEHSKIVYNLLDTLITEINRLEVFKKTHGHELLKLLEELEEPMLPDLQACVSSLATSTRYALGIPTKEDIAIDVFMSQFSVRKLDFPDTEK